MKDFCPSFVLVTAAYNAAGTIAKLIDSVVTQSLLPVRWIVVDDGSTDDTADVIRGYENRYDFIELAGLQKNHDAHSFGAKVRVLNHAVEKLDLSSSDYIGVLDADIELPPDYFSTLLARMQENESLGIAGGTIRPFYDGKYHDRLQNAALSVAGAVQMFKTGCFMDVGARFLVLPFGSEDAAMEIKARYHGWNVMTFEDLPVTHFGRVGVAAGSRLKGRYRKGLSYASIGYHPIFLLLRCIVRMKEFPWIVGSVCELCGFVMGITRDDFPLIETKFVDFLRKEQVDRLCLRRK